MGEDSTITSVARNSPEQVSPAGQVMMDNINRKLGQPITWKVILEV
jgi:hypothetical protein